MDIVAAGVDNEGIGQLFPKKPARPCAPATPADDSACPLVECRDWARRVSSDLCFRFRFRWGRRKRVIEFLEHICQIQVACDTRLSASFVPPLGATSFFSLRLSTSFLRFASGRRKMGLELPR